MFKVADKFILFQGGFKTSSIAQGFLRGFKKRNAKAARGVTFKIVGTGKKVTAKRTTKRKKTTKRRTVKRKRKTTKKKRQIKRRKRR